MFDLEENISQWRRQMLAAGIGSVERLEELESHVRDEIEAQARLGISAEAGFRNAIAQVGQPEILKPEFAKVRETVYERMKRLCFGFAGIQSYQLETNMNTFSNQAEPRWATYAKSAVMILPPVLVWGSFMVLVLPKLKQVCEVSGTELWRPIAAALEVTDFIKINFIVFSLVIMVVLALLEWRSGWWARYRKLVFGMVAYGLNLFVLLLIAALAVLAVVAAAHLVPGK